MAMFDPKKAREAANEDQGVPAGDYLIAMKSFQRKESKKNKTDYLRCRFIVIAGAASKKSFFDTVSLDTSNSGSMFRLSLLAEQCGVDKPFDLGSDADIRANLVGRPFKARINRKVENGYTNNGIERYLTGDAVTTRDKELMELWLLESQEEEEFNGGGGSSGGDGFDSNGLPDAPPPGDDDIPF